ncbi:TonB-dependent receptor [Paraferrimonas sp. SM1919]|uniref:TonB-dependent receptor n=1 Tax=Paraferrimonas sp. SM1919 TaxID=2662263 RepID=UPI0013D85FEB|nr:TonB-dependent receptor [Paraferrimonas sp. SM1919]
MKLNITAVAVMTALASQPILAEASETEQPVETIEVTGIRGGEIKALDLKREADTIVDAIAAGDIGDFPDHNIADSLARVTGVQVTTNDRGVSNTVSIRGLPSSFSKVLYNGHAITSISTGDDPARDFGFNSMPSEFAASVAVGKTSSADTPEGGLAGTVNIRTHRAFDSEKAVYLVSGNAVYDQNAEKYSPEGTLLWSDKFSDDLFGFTLGVNYTEQNQGVKRYRQLSPRKYDEKKMLLDANDNGEVSKDEFLATATQLNFEDFPISRKRTSALGNFEVRPSDEFKLFGEVFYTKMDIEASRFGVQAITNRKHDPAGTNVISEHNGLYYVDYGTMEDGRLQSRNQGQMRKGDMVVSLLEGLYTGDNWSLKPSVSYTKANTELTKWQINGFQFQKQVFEYNHMTGGDPAGFYFSSPEQQTLMASEDAMMIRSVSGGDFFRQIDNSSLDLRLDYDLNLDADIGIVMLNNLKLGLNYAIDKVENDAVELRDSGNVLRDALRAQVEQGGDYFALANHPSIGDFYVPDVLQIINTNGKDFFTNLVPSSVEGGTELGLEEKTTSIYARIDFSDGQGDFSGNFGIRYSRTEEATSGSVPNFNLPITIDVDGNYQLPTAEPVTRERTYAEVLPSVNLRYDVTDDITLRAAAGRTLTRNDFTDLQIFSEISQPAEADGDVARVTSSNIDIQPWLADNYDLAFEWYLTRESAFTTNFFYKDIKALTERNKLSSKDFAVLDLNTDTTSTETLDWRTDMNVDGATLKGMEVAYRVAFDFLPSFLSNTGINTNYTYLDNSAPNAIIGASKHNYNFMVYYSDSDLNAKLSYTYRDKYLRGLANENSAEYGAGEYSEARGILNASVKYKLFSGISLKFSGSNLTNSKDARTEGIYGWSKYNVDFGRRFTLGVQAKF